jgi:signal transduction histidine kinase
MTVMLFYHRNDQQAFEELLQRQQKLQSKREDLERELGARDRFIASVSHELRTPMNAILGLNSYLKSVVTDKPGAQMVLDHTSQAADYLMTIINDVLDYTQFKSGQLQPHMEGVLLRYVLEAAFGLFKPRVASSNLRYAL